MKAKSLLTACLFMLTVGANAANDGKAILHHDKKPVAIYDADKLSDALSAAVAGDTIYLSAGTFPTFTLEKAITIKGAGTNTKISNGVTIDIAGTPTLTAALLEAVEVNGAVSVVSDMTNFLIKMVKTTDLRFDNALNTPNALVDRCNLSKFTITSTMTDFYVRNSYIWNLTSTSLKFNKCNFINCRIQGDWNNAAGRFINCELSRTGDNYLTIKSSILSYSLVYSYYNSVDPSSYQEKVYSYGNNGWLSVVDRLNKGYICKDGSVVGVDGGKTPFTLTPSGPKETSSTVKVSDSEKKLNVSITVSPK
ncbi:MAG: hypothetical protein SOZ58_02475 [Prevotella sp.]|nr:hypothetical protein [Prevotella sp.]